MKQNCIHDAVQNTIAMIPDDRGFPFEMSCGEKMKGPAPLCQLTLATVQVLLGKRPK